MWLLWGLECCGRLRCFSGGGSSRDTHRSLGSWTPTPRGAAHTSRYRSRDKWLLCDNVSQAHGLGNHSVSLDLAHTDRRLISRASSGSAPMLGSTGLRTLSNQSALWRREERRQINFGEHDLDLRWCADLCRMCLDEEGLGWMARMIPQCVSLLAKSPTCKANALSLVVSAAMTPHRFPSRSCAFGGPVARRHTVTYVACWSPSTMQRRRSPKVTERYRL